MRVCDSVCRHSSGNGVGVRRDGLTGFTALNRDHVMCHRPKSQVQPARTVLTKQCLFKSKVTPYGECKTSLVLEARRFRRLGG